jgi:predicted Fe-Mo cluster-binding NifX family protein
MKIAIVSDDEVTISQHFGRAGKYMVYLIKQGQLQPAEILPKQNQCHSRQRRCHDKDQSRGMGTGSREKHARMFADIIDCDVVVSRGMGRGAYLGLMELDIQPIITDIMQIDEAVHAILDGTIVNHTDQLH